MERGSSSLPLALQVLLHGAHASTHQCLLAAMVAELVMTTSA